MKKIFITEKQEEILKNVMKESLSHNSSYDKSTSSLSAILNPNIEDKIIKKRYNEVKEIIGRLFNISNLSNDEIVTILSKTLSSCKKKEEKIKTNLEKLCFNFLYELFNIPEDFVKIDCSIVNKVDNSNVKIHINPVDSGIEFDDSAEIESMEDEIQKRMLLNTLIMGASIVLTKHILKLEKDKIKSLDATLYDDYIKIMWLNEYYMFSTNIDITDNTPNQAGGVDVKLGNDKTLTKINSKALCLPILLAETIRGLMELFISHGLPKDKNLAKYVLEYADTLKYQQYSIIAGPIVWNKIMGVMKENNFDTTIIPNFLTTLSEKNVSEFNEIMKEITLNTTKGKNHISQLLQDITNNIEYDDFETRLSKKREELNLLNDEEFMGEDELLDEDFLSGEDEIMKFSKNINYISYDKIFQEKN